MEMLYYRDQAAREQVFKFIVSNRDLIHIKALNPVNEDSIIDCIKYLLKIAEQLEKG